MTSLTFIRRFTTSLQNLNKSNPFLPTLKLYDPNVKIESKSKISYNDLKKINSDLTKKILSLEHIILTLETKIHKLNE
jgi:hypothetical protein